MPRGVAVAVHIDQGPGRPALYSSELTKKMAAAVRKAGLFAYVQEVGKEARQDVAELNSELREYRSSPTVPTPLERMNPPPPPEGQSVPAGYLIDTHLSMSQIHTWLPRPLAKAVLKPYVKVYNRCMAEAKSVVFDYKSREFVHMTGAAYPAVTPAAGAAVHPAEGNPYVDSNCSPRALIPAIEGEVVDDLFFTVVKDFERLILKLAKR